jgi:hypothetical protein
MALVLNLFLPVLCLQMDGHADTEDDQVQHALCSQSVHACMLRADTQAARPYLDSQDGDDRQVAQCALQVQLGKDHRNDTDEHDWEVDHAKDVGDQHALQQQRAKQALQHAMFNVYPLVMVVIFQHRDAIRQDGVQAINGWLSKRMIYVAGDGLKPWD